MMNLYKNRGGTPEEFVQVSSSLFLSFKLVVETMTNIIRYRVQLFFGPEEFYLGSFGLRSRMLSKTAFSSPLNRKKDRLLKTLSGDTSKGY
jgi:hypothetical protein